MNMILVRMTRMSLYSLYTNLYHILLSTCISYVYGLFYYSTFNALWSCDSNMATSILVNIGW